jgi:hypothetical protein
MSKKSIHNLVVVSDTHCGCRLALCPPESVQLDDGGTYRASKFQKQVWGLWREFWESWVPGVLKGEPYDIVHNGDVIDGTHHQSTTQISQNIQDQLLIAEQVIRPIVEKARKSGGNYYHIRGTDAHVGKSSNYEEMLARALGAVPNSEGQHARYDLWKRVGESLVHLLHHIGTTASAAHEASAVNAELTAEYVEAARWRKDPPDFIVRSHRHRYIGLDFDSARGIAAAVVTPGWQGKTPFAWKIAGARLAVPQFGGIIIRQGNEEAHYRRKVWSIGRSEEV